MRKLVTNGGATESAIKSVKDALEERLAEKGYHTFVSSHEISGVLREEYKEVGDAVHLNSNEFLRKELIDLAVACIWGIVSIDADALDW
jgi:hypothetical protein